MKADHGGFELAHQLQTFFAERCAAKARANRLRVYAVGLIKRRELLAPRRFFFKLFGGWGVAEKVDVHGQEHAPLNGLCICLRLFRCDGVFKGAEFVLQLLSCEHGRRHTAQAACQENGCSQPVVLRSGHGRLNQSDAVLVKKRCVHVAIIHWLEAHHMRRRDEGV